ncbi:MAG: hypothetical protein WBS24_14205 [Terriglobales bacterium]
MKTRMIALTVVVMCLVGVALCAAAENSMLGTWKLDESKSKIPAGASKSVTVVYEAAGNELKCTIDGVDGEGKPTHTEWKGKIDGKDYPVTGDPNQSTRSVKKINDHTMEVTVKKDGNVMMSGRIEISPNGKSRTVILSGTDPQGKKIQTASFYNKQ